MIEDRPLPASEVYRGVKVHAHQPAERIEHVVRPAIDAVYLMSNAVALADYAGDVRQPPEARLFAAARVRAIWELAAEGRAVRPLVNLDQLAASVAGLDSCTWVDPVRYGSMLDYDGAVERDQPLPADGACP